MGAKINKKLREQQQETIEAELDISEAIVWILGRFYAVDKQHWKQTGDMKQFWTFDRYLMEQRLIIPKENNGKSGD